MTAVIASRPVIAAKLAKVAQKNYRRGVLGLHAAAQWDGAEFTYKGETVNVIACPSVFAVWDALHRHRGEQWLVVLTPLNEEDLGASVLAHLIDGRLLTPDPWDALLSNFGATTLEPALYRVADDRGFALALLDTLGADDYTPAPAGVLTREHVFTAIAAGPLEIVGSRDVQVDSLALLEWSAVRTRSWDSLRTQLAEPLLGEFSTWLVARSGRLGAVVSKLLTTESLDQLVPLGVVINIFSESDDTAALDIFLATRGIRGVGKADIAHWGDTSAGFLRHSVRPGEQRALLNEAATLANDPDAAPLAERSEMLPVGLTARIRELGVAIERALEMSAQDTPVPSALLHVVERGWIRYQQHMLAASDSNTPTLDAATRLVRWLSTSPDDAPQLRQATKRHVREDAWVDIELNRVRRGVDDLNTQGVLGRLIQRVSARRQTNNHQFAHALADSPQPDVLTVEQILESLLVPLARRQPTLLIVVDALSVSAAAELARVAESDGWTELTVPGADSRTAALAVLPTLTQRSRCSLLAGQLMSGNSAVERREFVSVLKRNDLQVPGEVADPIFHKAALDAVPAGAKLATTVADAIADTDRQKLVAVVLNYVDDTIHHTDPGNTDWTFNTITHLAHLLTAAQRSGRAVVITSDHGHVIDRGDGIFLNRDAVYCHRAHGDTKAIDPEREVLVRGPRVMTDTNTVVLAVDESVRYQARNAGYHGGGSPAEVLVPVIVLVPGLDELGDGWNLVGRPEPAWWEPTDLPTLVSPPPPEPAKSKRKAPPKEQAPSLFDEPTSALDEKDSLGAEVVTTDVYKRQLMVAGRMSLSPHQVSSLIDALNGTGSLEITVGTAAAVLGVPNSRARGALMQAKRVLDVEGYEVLTISGEVVALKRGTLKEQFGL